MSPKADVPEPTRTIASTARPVVIDTNIVLDVWVFADPASAPLRAALEAGQLRWITTLAMHQELQRVLTYPQIVKSLAHHQRAPADVMAHCKAQAHPVEAAAKASVTCKDADDQQFIDLAVAHRALLLSKDKAVLCMAKRLAVWGVQVASAFALHYADSRDSHENLVLSAKKSK
jgi:putative PIN family toxin of toxin-antitoxin system